MTSKPNGKEQQQEDKAAAKVSRSSQSSAVSHRVSNSRASMSTGKLPPVASEALHNTQIAAAFLLKKALDDMKHSIEFTTNLSVILI